MRRARFGLVLLCLCACESAQGRSETSASEAGVSESSGSSSEDSDATTSESSSDTDSETSTETETGADPSDTGTETDSDSDSAGDPGASLGVFDLTYYWVSYEGDYAGAPDTSVGDCQGVSLAMVPANFASALKLEGTGKLLDDRILNIGGCSCGGGFDCFAELDPAQFPWGQGSKGNALVPFHTLATDIAVLPFGTSVYAPSLDGLALPDGRTHDGCLRAGDVGGGINGMHIDWFVGLKIHYQSLDADVPETVELFEGGTVCP